MVKKMNKESFINELAKALNFEKEKCALINDVLENNFFISKKNKEPIISELASKLNIDSEEATKIYDTAITIIKSEIKTSIKHPFRKKD